MSWINCTRPSAAARGETIAAPDEKKPALPETPWASRKADATDVFKVVQLDFSQHADLLELLRGQAKKEIRDLPGQIMWELKCAMAISVLPPCAYFPKMDFLDASGHPAGKEGAASAG